jgi:hypothetical protein
MRGAPVALFGENPSAEFPVSHGVKRKFVSSPRREPSIRRILLPMTDLAQAYSSPVFVGVFGLGTRASMTCRGICAA